VEQVGNAATWAECFALLDDVFAARQFLDGNRTGDAISPEVSWLRRQLVATGGQARVEPLMDETGWSRRVVTERFRTQLGVSPKAYARILRSSAPWACSTVWGTVGHWPMWPRSAGTTTSLMSRGIAWPWPDAAQRR